MDFNSIKANSSGQTLHEHLLGTKILAEYLFDQLNIGFDLKPEQLTTEDLT